MVFIEEEREEVERHRAYKRVKGLIKGTSKGTGIYSLQGTHTQKESEPN